MDALPATPAGSRPGLRLPAALLLLAIGLALNVSRLAGPFTDGQAGNCGAMFAIFARNEAALGLPATRGVPVVNPVPPATPAAAEVYAHHPPGLPWLVMLASHLPLAIETAGRLVALLAFLAATLLVADLGARLAGPGAALAAGLLMLLLPAGRHDATLVNYETVALPALLLLLRALRLGVGRAWPAAALAALVDWIALLPLLFGPGAARRRAWREALVVAGVIAAGWLLLARSVAPQAAGGTLAQGVAATFLARDFSASAWITALGSHLAALYGWALLPAALSLLALRRQAPATRGLLLRLLAVGALNVLVFAQHATGHEHFSLLLLPWVALSTAVLLFPGTPAGTQRRELRRAEPAANPSSERPNGARGAGRRASRALALGAMAALLVAATWQAQRQMPERTSTTQAALADGLRAAAPEQGVYVRPGGAPFVFLHRALRHVVPTGAGSLEQARALAGQYRQRFGLPGDWPACAALAPGEPAPAWLLAQPGADGPADGWRCVPLGP